MFVKRKYAEQLTANLKRKYNIPINMQESQEAA